MSLFSRVWFKSTSCKSSHTNSSSFALTHEHLTGMAVDLATFTGGSDTC